MEPPKAEEWRRENFFADDNYISSHTVLGGVFLRRKCNLLWILIENEATGEDLVRCFADGLSAGVVEPSIPTLVDLTRFTGAVDWTAIRAVRDLAAWGRGVKRNSRIAYVVRDGQFAALVKIVAALFPRSVHRAFYKLDDAVSWLSGSELREARSR